MKQIYKTGALFIATISMFNIAIAQEGEKKFHLKTDISEWTRSPKKGNTYVNDSIYIDDFSKIVITPSYKIIPEKAPNKNSGKVGYIQIKKAGTGDNPTPEAEIIFPKYQGVKTVTLGIYSGAKNRRISLFNKGEEDPLYTFISEKGDNTLTYTVPEKDDAKEFEFILKKQNGVLFITDIEIEKSKNATAIHNLTESPYISNIHISNNTLYFNSSKEERIEIFNILGKTIYRGVTRLGSNSIYVNYRGVAVIKIGNRRQKIIIN